MTTYTDYATAVRELIVIPLADSMGETEEMVLEVVDVPTLAHDVLERTPRGFALRLEFQDFTGADWISHTAGNNAF